MKNLNKLLGLLLVGGCIGSVSAADAINTNEETSASVATKADVSHAKKPLITLSQVNQLRREPDVTILVALPPLPEGTRPTIPFDKGSAGLKFRGYTLNGQKYDLWSNYGSWDLESLGGVSEYTYDDFGDSTIEVWHENYYLIQQGENPGQSKNILDLTGMIPRINGTVYVCLGEIFLNQRAASYYDNAGHERKEQEVQRARDRALAERNGAVK